MVSMKSQKFIWIVGAGQWKSYAKREDENVGQRENIKILKQKRECRGMLQNIEAKYLFTFNFFMKTLHLIETKIIDWQLGISEFKFP